jgi:hypothetical protein
VPLAGKPPVRRRLLIRSFTVNAKASAADSRRPHQGRASDSSGALRQAGRTVAEERTLSQAPTPCLRGRLRGIESGGRAGSCHDEGRAREAR